MTTRRNAVLKGMRCILLYVSLFALSFRLLRLRFLRQSQDSERRIRLMQEQARLVRQRYETRSGGDL